MERDDSYSGINAIVFTECILHTHITQELELHYVTHCSSAEVPEPPAATLTGGGARVIIMPSP